jgi:membrane-anchored mycosin MYCP
VRVTSVLLGAVCGCALGLVATTGPASAEPACDSPTTDYPVGSVWSQLDIGRAQNLVQQEAPKGHPPVAVAVLDSGVAGEGIPVAGREVAAGGGEVRYYHGTAVAGIIAGQPDGDQTVGFAPDAEIVDVRVYDVPGAEDDGKVVTSDGIAAGLEWVAANARDLNIRIANVSLIAKPSDRLERAVREVRRKNVVVVAAAGNRPAEGQPFDELFEDGGPGPDEDASTVLFPTGYDDVVSVSSTAAGSDEPDAGVLVLENSHTTVAVPTQGVVSYGLDGRPCVIPTAGTSWAAAEVSGVLALLWQMYPDDTDEQIIARLVNTATGTTDHRTPLTGAGVVQPLEALTRQLGPNRAGEVETTTVVQHDSPPAVAPEPEEDTLAETREDAVWWGLIGGGILVVALLLRPVLARRRF